MGDANGLKLANDAFGHQEGDKLLVRIAQILRGSCRKEDIIARWGGDEFTILLPSTSQSSAGAIVDRIRKGCLEAERSPIPLSIALGTATKEEAGQDIYHVLREAEERMYRQKLAESRNTRSLIISALEKELWAKDHQTEARVRRSKELVLAM